VRQPAQMVRRAVDREESGNRGPRLVLHTTRAYWSASSAVHAARCVLYPRWYLRVERSSLCAAWSAALRYAMSPFSRHAAAREAFVLEANAGRVERGEAQLVVGSVHKRGCVIRDADVTQRTAKVAAPANRARLCRRRVQCLNVATFLSPEMLCCQRMPMAIVHQIEVPPRCGSVVLRR